MDPSGLQFVDSPELLRLIVHNAGEGAVVADTEGALTGSPEFGT